MADKPTAEAQTAVAEGFAQIMEKRHPGYRWLPVEAPAQPPVERRLLKRQNRKED